MPILGERERTYVRQQLAGLKDPVVLEVARGEDCPSCDLLEELVGEMTEVVPDLSWRPAPASEPDLVPALKPLPAVLRPRPYEVRFYGLPAGYEFSSLLAAIQAISAGESGLSPGLRRLLGELRTPLDVKVFVTQSCPYCPRMVQLAHRLAVESPYVTASMVDAAEFPDMAARYRVSGVPLTVVNDAQAVVGAVAERQFEQFLADVVA